MVTKPDPIMAIDTKVLRIPFDDASNGMGLAPKKWDALDIVLVRVETESGLVGWGEGFGYTCQHVTAIAMREMIAPFAIGKDSRDPAALNRAAQFAFHIFGRFGVVLFAISALDIALWDIAAKREGVSLSRLLGRKRSNVPAYASLVRYGHPDTVHRIAADAVKKGYRYIKLHEVAEDCIAAGRDAAPDAEITVDANCQIDAERALAMVPFLKAQNIEWLEEPTFPPEDTRPWNALRAQGINIAAGENVCTLEGFAPLIPALDYVQPSVTKVGGVTEFLRVAGAVRAGGKKLAPHSPYFGPGYWATLQLAASVEGFNVLEYLYITPEAACGQDIPLPIDAMIAIPDRPGIGFEPDFGAIEKYEVRP